MEKEPEHIGITGSLIHFNSSNKVLLNIVIGSDYNKKMLIL